MANVKLRGVWNAVRRVILWDYPRASWQYDIMVAVVVAFIFLTPRDWFHDQARIPQSHEVALLPSARGSSVFWLEPEFIAGIPADLPQRKRLERVGDLLKSKTGREQAVTRLDPVYNSEHELTGYMAVAKP